MIQCDDMLSRAGLLHFPFEGETDWGIFLKFAEFIDGDILVLSFGSLVGKIIFSYIHENICLDPSE